MTNLRRTFALLILAAACGPAPAKVDEIAANAAAECEPATDSLRTQNEFMLPGRVCINCHRAGGQAAAYPWTFAGTVFGSGTARCNSGGLAGVTVEILKIDGTVQDTATTNMVGNFYSKTPITTPFRARVSGMGKMKEMAFTPTTGACASCHSPTAMAGGRIFLN